MPTELLTEKEIGLRYGLSPNWLAKLRVSGDGPPYLKLRRLVRYDPMEVEKWLASHVRTSTSDRRPVGSQGSKRPPTLGGT